MMSEREDRARAMAAAEFGVTWDGLNKGKPVIDRMAKIALTFADAELERAAFLVQDLPPLQQMPDWIVPAHIEYDDYGEPICEIQERIERRKRLTNNKDAADAIRKMMEE